LDYLKNIATHSHVLVYDWTEEGDVSTVVEDIETLNFDYDKRSKKMADWIFDNVQELRTKRQHFEDRYYLHVDYMKNDYNVPELHFTAEQVIERKETMEMVCIYKLNFFIAESCELHTSSVIIQSHVIIY